MTVLSVRTHARGLAPEATRTHLVPLPAERLQTEPWETAAAAASVGEDLTRWSDEQLCWAWRVSYGQLAHAPGHKLDRLALQRRRYLDELERRNPTGFAAWLGSGARAPSNPARYITSPTLPVPHVSSDPGDPGDPTGATLNDP